MANQGRPAPVERATEGGRREPEETPQADPANRGEETRKPLEKIRFPVGPELEDLIFSVTRRFFDPCDRSSVEQLAEWATAELARRRRNLRVTRQQVYPLIAEAMRLGFIRFTPPDSMALAQRIADRCRTDIDNVCVINVGGVESVEPLAIRAAAMLFELILKVARDKKDRGIRETEDHKVRVCIGLGCGHSTRAVAKHLSQRFRSNIGLDFEFVLCVHSMNCGFDPLEPEVSAASYFGFFSDLVVPVRCVGLFCQAVVEAKKFEDLKKQYGLEDSFARAGEIDIVLTALGSPHDSLSLLNRFENHYLARSEEGKRDVARRRAQRAGDVQFRGYTADGPIHEVEDEIRAVTLFELEDLVRLVKDPRKHVLLVSGVNKSKTTRTDALMPLLTNPRLRVWSHLCLDLQTATEAVERLVLAAGPPRAP